MAAEHPFLLYPSYTYTWYSEKTYNGTRESYQEQYSDWFAQVRSVYEALAQASNDYQRIRQALLVGWVTYRWKEVEQGLHELLDFNPQDVALLFYLGEIAWFGNPQDTPQAQAHYQAYIATHPTQVSETHYFLDG